MNNFLRKILVGTFLFATAFAAYCQPGNQFEDEDGDTSGTVEPPATINSKLFILIIIGIIFAIYYFKSNKAVKTGTESHLVH